MPKISLSDCIEWMRGKTTAGYGSVWNAGTGKVAYAHREAWSGANGPIPEGMCVCHKCDNRGCVNPEHLFLGTKSDNARDMVEKGRSARFEKHSQAKLTWEDVREIHRLRALGFLHRELADKFGCCRSNISAILRGRTWVKP